MIVTNLDEVVKSLPTANGSETGVIVKDSLGRQYSKPIGEFGCTARLKTTTGTVLRISNIGSVFISTRGTNGGRCALIWVSSYANGDKSRTSTLALRDYSSHYEWYVNGPSESKACVYLKLLGSSGDETVTATSLLGERPIIEIVDSVPTDASKITFTS